MRRLRPIDAACGLLAVATALAPAVVGDGWGSVGWLTAILCGWAVAAGLAAPALTAARRSPSGPVLALVLAVVGAAAAVVALLADGAWVPAAVAAALLAAAFRALRDPRSPGAPDRPVAARPAPPAA